MLTEAAERGQEVVQPPAIREEKKVGILSYFRPASRVKPLAKRSRFRQRKWFRGSQVAALRKKGNGRTAPKKRREGVGSEAAARLAGFPSLSFLYLFLSFFFLFLFCLGCYAPLVFSSSHSLSPLGNFSGNPLARACGAAREKVWPPPRDDFLLRLPDSLGTARALPSLTRRKRPRNADPNRT